MRGRRIRRIRLVLVAALVSTTIGLVLAASAQAVPAFEEFNGVTANSDGTSSTAAGAHPSELVTNVQFETVPGPLGSPVPKGGAIKSINVDLPPGVVGNPLATPRCSLQELMDPDANLECQGSMQIGLVEVSYDGTPTAPTPLYNMVPPKGVVAQFAFNISGVPTFLNSTVRSGGDYGVSVVTSQISQALTVTGAKVTVWGVPAASSHDSDRTGFCLSSLNPEALCPSDAPKIPLLSNAADCEAGALETRGQASSWPDPATFAMAGFNVDQNGNVVEVDECDRVPFEGRMDVTGISAAADSPTGLQVDLRIDQTGLLSPTGVAPSPLKRAVVALPAGVRVNPASAANLSGCAPWQIALDRGTPAQCPASSKIGEVEIETPAVEGVLPGELYVATQGTNPFNSLLALYIAIDDPESGIVVKLPGKLSPDPRTGQLTASFDGAPQLPFERMRLRIKDGPRAPLVTPPDCGTYTTHAELTGWARRDSPIISDSKFTINRGCGGAAHFAPGFQAGATNPVGGAYSPFRLRVTRADGEQNVSRIEATLPKGLLAKLAGIPLCSDGAAASGNCPAASQVGRVIVGAGAGTNPLYVPQPGKSPTALYLAGPYRGGSYSLVAEVPAQAGPFDLGTVTVRNALYVDQFTAQVTAKSDPLPQILKGIPISYRDIRVEVDRNQFTLNPTSCDPTEVAARITSDTGTQVHPASRFQVGSCAALPFKPKLKLHLKGSTTRTGHPALKAVVTYPKEGTYANIARAQVGLPHSEFLDQGNLNKVCKQADLKAGTCPKESIYGWAKAWTPLLAEPLQGPVYLGVGFGYKLPALVADLNGQIRIMLVGRVDTTKRDGIRNTFEVVPDAPVSRFVLRMKGGKKYGLLENSENVCRKKQRASALFIGQNGDRLHMRPRIHNGCGKAKRNKTKRKAHARASGQRHAAHRGQGRE